MITERNAFWIYIGDAKRHVNHMIPGGICGKYLFFSESQQMLIDIAEEEIAKHDFFVAKVSTTPRNGTYVLCLYWINDTRKHELARRYPDDTYVQYRYWKSNEDTRKGIYSEQHRGGIK
jgi:hypothetical protein